MTAPSSSSPLLECHGVSLGHVDPDTGRESVLAREVSFSVRPGELVLIVGASGSGKTTLLRLLNRFDEPLAGQLDFRGRPLSSYDPLELRRKVVLVPQRAVMFEGSVEQNLRALPRELPAPDDDALGRVMRAVGLPSALRGRVARELSGGEQQRLAIARGLLLDPDVLLLDEPTSALDPRSAQHVGELVGALARQRALGVVVVTHSPELIAQLRGRVLLLGAGAVVLDPEREALDRFLAGA